ncbi:imidazole glycerol phosphate synthase subunit HisH [Lactococcus nasutitermitis]|uniref:Imidazole glycerol phosphate synthase subunit HisH n=1 Tax=Lactococcus nasutitermitis TaxID=1652957 RepID=A0ABV9JI40_9LACT|nr:imidazole glycerol phosphate synthase subunit HisH [Lactococcus nasutitermitis]
MISIIDYNVGNLQSVEAAFARLGMETTITRDPAIIKKSNAIVLPGVGAFPIAMKNLQEFGLVELLQAEAASGKPFLGICLGMQVLFDEGTENGKTQGLGLLTGTVDPIRTDEKLPHMGWNQLKFNQPNHSLLSKITEGDEAYFVHSYQANCPSDELIATTTYGNMTIPAIVGRDNVLGCQFHPEKSGEVGHKILTAFKEIIEK